MLGAITGNTRLGSSLVAQLALNERIGTRPRGCNPVFKKTIFAFFSYTDGRVNRFRRRFNLIRSAVANPLRWLQLSWV